MAIDSSGNLWVPNNSGIVSELVGVAAPVLTPMVACLTKNAAREGLSAVEGEVSALDPERADELFKCRGRDSNPLWLAKTPNAPESLRVFRSAAVESPACLSSSDPSSRLLPADSVIGRLWSWRICRSASSPDVALKEKGPSPFGPAPHLTPRPTYFLRFVFVARAADP